MGLLNRIRRGRYTAPRPVTSAVTDYLRSWAAQRHGVEAYVEPETTVTQTTVILIAHDGEWTRRRIDGAKAAAQLGKKLGIPVYDVGRTGYPQRMRDYQNRQRVLRKRRRNQALED